MSQKTIQTKILQRTDSSEHWKKDDAYCPSKGELIVTQEENQGNKSAVTIKIGDGETKVSNLVKVASTELMQHTHTITPISHRHSYTPAGTIESIFSDTTGHTHTIDGIPASIETTIDETAHTHSYTPAGTISQPTFTGTSGETDMATVSIPATSTCNSSVTVNKITAVGTLPTLTVTAPTLNLTGDSTNKTLTITFNPGSYTLSGGSLPTVESVTVATGNHTHSITSTAHTHSYTPAGTISQPTFTGTLDYTSEEDIDLGITNSIITGSISTNPTTVGGSIDSTFTGTLAETNNGGNATVTTSTPKDISKT